MRNKCYDVKRDDYEFQNANCKSHLYAKHRDDNCEYQEIAE